MASNESPLRVMLDANVLIAGIRVPRWPYEVLQHALAKDYVPVVSVQVIREARKHLSGPRQRQALEYFLAQSGYEEAPTPSKAKLNIVLPAVFLREVMGWTSEQLEAIRYRQWLDMVSDLPL